MRKLLLITLLSLAIAGVSVPAQAQPIPGQYIVVLHDGGNPNGVANAHGLSMKNKYTGVFNGFAAKIPAQALKGLSKNPHVASIQPDRMVHAIAQITPTGVDRIEAELDFTPVPVDAGVAVIDTGIDLDHPDLNVVYGVDCRRLNKKTGDCKIGGDDDNGHGSHVAGTVAAYNDANGVVGVAPGARLYAVKVLDRTGSGTLSGVIQGIDWVERNATAMGIGVANLSLSGAGTDDTDGNPLGCSITEDAEHQAFCRLIAKGVVVVVAAGNENSDAQYSTPSAFDEVITVSALADFDGQPGGLGSDVFAFSDCTEDVDDSFACFSNFGHDIDIMAPGVGIYSTYKDGGYAESSGTSMAAPHVAGAAALLKASNPALTHQAVRDLLVDAGDPAPCDTPDGVCADDPDGIQEPLLMLGEPEPECEFAVDCDDANDCTVDSCAGGFCVNAPVLDDTGCPGGICCGGVCSPSVCVTDLDCADADICTDETCLLPGTCAASCSYDEPACSGAVADGCCPTGCDWTTDADCTCSPACSTDAECADADMCTADSCVNPGACDAVCANDPIPDCQTCTVAITKGLYDPKKSKLTLEATASLGAGATGDLTLDADGLVQFDMEWNSKKKIWFYKGPIGFAPYLLTVTDTRGGCSDTANF